MGNATGNLKEQWKEVKDNRVQSSANQNGAQGITGKEIVPVNHGVEQQLHVGNKVKTNAKHREVQVNDGKEIVPLDQRANKQVQIGNKFAFLEMLDEEEEADNQLVLVGEKGQHSRTVSTLPDGKHNLAQQSQKPNPTTARRLNPTAPIINSTLAMIESKKARPDISPIGISNEEPRNKESTTQWVQRTFNGSIVAINTSCKYIPSQDTHVEGQLAKQSEREIPSQSVNTNATAFGSKDYDRLQLFRSKLWCDQV